MTYTIKPLQFAETYAWSNDYATKGCGLNYKISKLGNAFYRLTIQNDWGQDKVMVGTLSEAIAAANEHHRRQIEKFLLPVE